MIEKINEINENKESDVRGEGWGDCHVWKEVKLYPNDIKILRFTTWKCKKCFCVFNHMYNYIPDIFTAMKACKVPNVCSRSQSARLNKIKVTGINL